MFHNCTMHAFVSCPFKSVQNLVDIASCTRYCYVQPCGQLLHRKNIYDSEYFSCKQNERALLPINVHGSIRRI